MQHVEIIAVCFVICIKHLKTLWGQNAERVIVGVGGKLQYAHGSVLHVSSYSSFILSLVAFTMACSEALISLRD